MENPNPIGESVCGFSSYVKNFRITSANVLRYNAKIQARRF